jgi:hypothetical protein
MFTVIVMVINMQAQMLVSVEEVTVMLANLPVSGEKGTVMLLYHSVWVGRVAIMQQLLQP